MRKRLGWVARHVGAPALESFQIRTIVAHTGRGTPVIKPKFSHPTLYHGLTPDAREFVARADSEYANGQTAGTQPGRKTIIAPVLTDFIASSRQHYQFADRTGELREKAPLMSLEGDVAADDRLKMENRLRAVFESPMDTIQKAEVVVQLLGEAQKEKLPLSQSSCTDAMLILHRASQELSDADATQVAQLTSLKESDRTAATLEPGVPEFAPPALTVPFLEQMMALYFHTRGTFTAPSAATMETLMATMACIHEPNERLMHCAIRVLQDGDKFTVLPSTLTYASFFQICDANACMDLAVTRFSDAVRKLRVIADAPMCQTLLTGLNRHGMIEEAVGLIARIEHVALTTSLGNAILNSFLLSDDPHSVFASYEAIFRQRELAPDNATFDIVLLACERTGIWETAVDVLGEMQRHKVKGGVATLNLLLKAMMRLGRQEYAEQLYLSMKAKNVEVWDTLEPHLPSRLQQRGNQLADACVDKEATERKALLRSLTLQSVGSAPPRAGFVIPKTSAELKRLAQKNALGRVDPDYLRAYLVEAGHRSASAQMSHRRLVREVHLQLYGVLPVRVAPIVPNRSGARQHRTAQ